jgi:Acetyltransferase (GNAT) domain
MLQHWRILFTPLPPTVHSSAGIAAKVGQSSLAPDPFRRGLTTAESTARWSGSDVPLATDWLQGSCAEPNHFYLPMLLQPALEYLREETVHCIEPQAAGVPIALLPVTASQRHGRFPVAHCTNWIHRHGFYGAPLLRKGHEDAGWEAVLAALDAAPWSGHFLHLRRIEADGPAAQALARVCARQGRRLEEVGRSQRALLHSRLDAQAYWEQQVRAKKRKELRRLVARLSDEGPVQARVLRDAAELPDWIDTFLAIERAGWKGERGTALASSPADTAFFRTGCAAAMASGALDLLRLDCGDRTIAMLLNFVGPDGAFSFKIAVDPAFARYSPGVLIEQFNLVRVLDDRVAPWMDSCAAPDHPMIDSLWGERRTIAQYRVALRHGGISGAAGRLVLPALSVLEAGFQRLKRRMTP